jgi:hypothetical protein
VTAASVEQRTQGVRAEAEVACLDARVLRKETRELRQRCRETRERSRAICEAAQQQCAISARRRLDAGKAPGEDLLHSLPEFVLLWVLDTLDTARFCHEHGLTTAGHGGLLYALSQAEHAVTMDEAWGPATMQLLRMALTHYELTFGAALLE